MSVPLVGQEGPKVKRLAGILYPDEERLEWTLRELSFLWGEPELVSGPVPFDRTDYYRDIAPELTRRFVCFPGLLDAGGLADWKHASCGVESRSRTPRAVNIDPGYLDGARLVLASTKDHAHRIWLRDGIYAEVTLRYRFGHWESFDYTFPDFRSGVYDAFLSEARALWMRETGRGKRPSGGRRRKRLRGREIQPHERPSDREKDGR